MTVPVILFIVALVVAVIEAVRFDRREVPLTAIALIMICLGLLYEPLRGLFV